MITLPKKIEKSIGGERELMDSLTLFYFDRFEHFRINHPEAMAITMSPITKFKHLTCWRQHHKYGLPYHNILSRSCHHMFIPEFRSTDNSIHYHGYIAPFNKQKFKDRFFTATRRLGFITVKANVNWHWSLYCVKETKYTAPLINNFFGNCGPYMYYHNIKKLFPNDLERLNTLYYKSLNAVKTETTAIKKTSENIKGYWNFPEMFKESNYFNNNYY